MSRITIKKMKYGKHTYYHVNRNGKPIRNRDYTEKRFKTKASAKRYANIIRVR